MKSRRRWLAVLRTRGWRAAWLARLRARVAARRRNRLPDHEPVWLRLWRLLRVWRPSERGDRWLAILESAALPLLALALAWRIDPADPLGLKAAFPWVWFGPWLAGVRYGAGYGLFGVAINLAVWAAWAAPQARDFPGEFFLGGALVSLILGEFGSAYRNQAVRHREVENDLRARLERAKRRLFVVRESLAQLEQELTDRPMTLRDALLALRRRLVQDTTAHADDDAAANARRLPDPLAFLQLLSQSCRIAVAGIFQRQGEGWVLLAQLGQQLPALDAAHPLVVHVLETGEVAHVAQSRLTDPRFNEWVFAAALRRDERGEIDALLAVHSMPFMAFDEVNLRRLQVLCMSYADFAQLEQGVVAVRVAWPQAPISLQHEWAQLVALYQRSRLPSYCALWSGKEPLSAEVLAEFASQQPSEASSWTWATSHGHEVLIVLLPIMSSAGLVVYRRDMIEVLETILRRQGQGSPPVTLEFFPVRDSSDFAALRHRLGRL